MRTPKDRLILSTSLIVTDSYSLCHVRLLQVSQRETNRSVATSGLNCYGCLRLAMKSRSVVDALVALAHTMSGTELAAYKLLLGASLRELSSNQALQSPRSKDVMATVLGCIDRVQSEALRWRGKPECIREGMLVGLDSEAMFLRCQARKQGHPSWAEGGPLAESLAMAPELSGLVEAVVGPILPTGRACYYYDEPTYGVPANLDLDPSTVRGVLALPSDASSRVSDLHQTLDDPIGPGEMLLFYPADSLCMIGDRITRCSPVYLTIDFQHRCLPSHSAPFVPSPPAVIDRMLMLAQVSTGDVLYDLGCGDGRVLIAAVKQVGASGVGFEIDAALVALARSAVASAGFSEKVKIIEGDATTADLTDATAITLFLNPETNERLRPKLERECPSGCRLVSHWWPVNSWVPSRIDHVPSSEGSFSHRVYLYKR